MPPVEAEVQKHIGPQFNEIIELLRKRLPCAHTNYHGSTSPATYVLQFSVALLDLHIRSVVAAATSCPSLSLTLPVLTKPRPRALPSLHHVITHLQISCAAHAKVPFQNQSFPLCSTIFKPSPLSVPKIFKVQVHSVTKKKI